MKLVGATAGAALAPISLARAQTGRIFRIGILETIGADRNRVNLSALRRGLRDLGYVEGQNLHIDYRSADGHADRFPSLADELVQLNVDLIVTRGAPAAMAAKATSSTIPLVMAAIGEPQGVGIVASLARPGSNATGTSAFVTELSGKRVELLREAFPLIARIGFLQNLGNPASPPQWDSTQAMARALGLSATLFDVRNEAAIATAFTDMAAQGVNVLSVGIDALTQARADMIAELAAKHKVLAIYPAREFVELGGLFSYGPDYPELYVRAAGLVDRIFKGRSPADLPVGQPARFELVINLKTLKTLDLAITPALLARADGVIE